jgi:branched-chain amino acid transport system permease protein
VHFSELYHQFFPLTVDGLTIGSIYALVALGYTLVYGVLRLINFAHSEVFMVGTFGALWATRWMGITIGPGSFHQGIGLVLILVGVALVAMAFSGGTAVLLERIAYRPLRKRGATRLAALISAIGASIFLQELFAQTWFAHRFHIGLRTFTPFPRLFQKTHHVLWKADFRSDKILILVSAIVMMLVLDRFVAVTRLGRGIRSVAQDPETAALMGVNIDRVVSVTFLLGGIMAGAAGMLYLVFFENTVNTIGFLLGIKAFTAAVLGGIGNLRGALLGGLFLGLLENYGASIFGSQWKDVISFTVLVLVLMIRPTGLLGEAIAKARA